MESSSSLTKLELDAVLQLIQLSSGSGDDLRFLWLDLAEDRRRQRGGSAPAPAEESSISSSSSINDEEILDDDDEPLPRINHRFGSLVDIYSKADHTPLINNRSKKRARF